MKKYSIDLHTSVEFLSRDVKHQYISQTMHKITKYLIIVSITIIGFIFIVKITKCNKSITTVNGSNQQIYSGNLIFDENFNSLDTNIWQADETLWRGGV